MISPVATESAASFDPVVERLGATNELLTLDLRGHGESGAADTYDLSSMAGDVATVVAAAEVTQPHVVGHSLGGVVARYYVQRMGGDARVHTVCTLGSPHAGTWAAHLLPTALVRQLRPGSDLMQELDAPSPGSGKVFDWRLAADVPDSVRLILAGGLDPDNVADAIEIVEPWGVDVASGVEAGPGRKDPTKVRKFIANARAPAPSPFLGPDELPYDWADE